MLIFELGKMKRIKSRGRNFCRGGIDYRGMISEINGKGIYSDSCFDWWIMRREKIKYIHVWNFWKEFEYDFARDGLLDGFLINLPSFLRKNELDVRLSLIFKKFHLYGFRLWISNRKPRSSSNILYIRFLFHLKSLSLYIYIRLVILTEYILNASL